MEARAVLHYPSEYITRDLSNERGVLYDDAGEVLWTREGDSYHVEVDEKDFPLFKGRIFSHNHPGNSPISPGDLELACISKLKEIRVTTIPYLYSLQPLESWNGRTYHKVARRMDEIGRELGLFDDEYNIQYSNDDENIKASAMEEWPMRDIKEWNRVWRKVSKECGLVFKSWPWR